MLSILLKCAITYAGWYLARFVPARFAKWRRAGIVVFLLGLPFIENFSPLPFGIPFFIFVYMSLGVFVHGVHHREIDPTDNDKKPGSLAA